MRGVGSPETEHENMAVDPTKSCWVVGIAITEGATRGRGGAEWGWGREQWGWEWEKGGGERINQLTKYIHCQTTRTVSLQFVYFVPAAYCLI